MIQRIQTIYLAVAALLCLACLCLPIASFTDGQGEVMGTLFNLWVHIPSPIGSTITTDASAPVLAQEAAGTHVFTPCALFGLLVITTTGLLFDIFLFRQRLVQSRLALLCGILLIGWNIVYGIFLFILKGQLEADFQLTPWAAFPAIAAILSYLAFRAILKDEMLVRSLDRLR